MVTTGGLDERPFSFDHSGSLPAAHHLDHLTSHSFVQFPFHPGECAIPGIHRGRCHRVAVRAGRPCHGVRRTVGSNHPVRGLPCPTTGPRVVPVSHAGRGPHIG